MTDLPTKTKADPALPSGHIVHADVLENEMQNRLHQFNSGIIALQGEMEGQEKAKNDQVAEIEAKHQASKADLLRRIADLEKGRLAVSAALDVLSPAKVEATDSGQQSQAA